MSSRAKSKSRRALGKGLGALIPGAGKGKSSGREYFVCPVDRIVRQPDSGRSRYRPFDSTVLRQGRYKQFWIS